MTQHGQTKTNHHLYKNSMITIKQ